MTKHESSPLSWFTGKAHFNAVEALELLARSAKQEFWLPGASRKVRAALSKVNVAAKYAKALPDRYFFGHEKGYPAYGDAAASAAYHAQLDAFETARNSAHKLSSAMTYGSPTSAALVNFEALRRAARPGAETAFVQAGELFLADFEGVWALMAKLDATRPKPVFTQLGVSPTITATLAGMNASLLPGSLAMPDQKWTRVEYVGKDGTVGWTWEVELVWPEGTVFGSSRHAYAGRAHRCCHACGHAIRNSYNWVPLYALDTAGVAHALWVGRDCAESLFGIKMSGELAVTSGPGAEQRLGRWVSLYKANATRRVGVES